MTKLLDFVKEKGLTHADTMKLIEEHYIKPEEQEGEPDDPDIDGTEDGKPDDEVEVKDEDKLAELVEKLADEEEVKIKKLADDEEAKIEADKLKIAELVQEELKKRGKVKRKTPSKGELTKIPKLNYDINTKGYEVKTTRRIKK